MENGGNYERRRKLPLEIETIEGVEVEQEPHDTERNPAKFAPDNDLEKLEAERARLDEEEIKAVRKTLENL